MKKINLAGSPPIADIQENVIFANNGNVVACYKATLPEIYSLSERDFEDLHTAWFQAIKSLPTGCVVHKQDIYLKKKYSSEELPCNTFLEKATHDYFKGREFLDHRCLLFFILTRNTALNNPRYVNPFGKVKKGIPNLMEDNLRHFLGGVKDSVSFLNNSRKLELQVLEEKEILEYTSDYFNGFNKAYDTDILLGKSDITVGEHHFDILAVNSELCFGESVQSSKNNEGFTSDDFVFHQGFIDGLGLTLDENHIVNQVIYLDDK